MALSTYAATGSMFPTSIEDKEDLLIATLDEMDKSVEDMVDIHDPVWMHFQENGGIEYVASRGLYRPINLRYKSNATVQWANGYDDALNIPAEGLTQAKAQYGNITGVQMYAREEVEALEGPQQLIDLADDKREQLETDLNNAIATHLMSSNAANGAYPDSLGAIVTYDAALHGITPTTAGYEFWNPVKTYKTGTTAFALATEFRAGVRKFVRALSLYNRKPNILLICGEDVYDEFQAWAEGKVEMTIKELFKSENWGDANTFTSRGNSVVYSPQLGAKVMWGFDLTATKIRVPRTTNMVYTPWQQLEGKVAAKKRNLLHTMCVYTKDRRRNGSITYS